MRAEFMSGFQGNFQRFLLASAGVALRVSSFWFQQAMTSLQQTRTILICFFVIISLIFLHPMQRMDDLVMQITRGAESATTGAILGLDSGASTLQGLGTGPGGVTYSLTGPDASFFEIDPASGEVRIKEKPDFERKQNYVFDVHASRDEASVEQKKRIQLNVINESVAPPAPLPYPMSFHISENKPAGTLVYRPDAPAPRGERRISSFLLKGMRPLLVFLGVLLPLAILIQKWRDPWIRGMLSPYMLLILAEIFTVPIATAFGNNGSEYAVGATYSLLRILQVIGILWILGVRSRPRWLRRLMLMLMGLWSVNFVGLLLLPF